VSVRNRSVSDRHHETRSQVLCYVDHRRYETVSILGPVGVPSPDTPFPPESRIHASCQLIHCHGSNRSVSISLTFDPVTNTLRPLHVTLCTSPPTCHSLYVTPYTSLPVCRPLAVTLCTSLLARHPLHVILYTSLYERHSLHATLYTSTPARHPLHVILGMSLSVRHSPQVRRL